MTPAINKPLDASIQQVTELLRALDGENLLTQSGGLRWGITVGRFKAALARSAALKFSPATPSLDELGKYLTVVHLEDLALATACVEGSAAAWEYFLQSYRGYLRAAAGVILKRSSDSEEARELADSLYADLYGMDESKPGRGSLLRYFHGRSKLSTWLRAVLAQRHIDAIRWSRRWESLDETQEDGSVSREAKMHVAAASAAVPLPDPHRRRYLQLLSEALTQAIRELGAYDRLRLGDYYLREQTLSEMGRRLGEHEATASRKLDRIRNVVRSRVEELLRTGAPAGSAGSRSGLDHAQISLCFEYALEDWPMDWSKVLDEQGKPGTPAGKPRHETT